MSAKKSDELGGLFLKLGSKDINLADYTREASDRWLKVTNQDTWSSTLSRVRIARQEALENTLESIRASGFPDRGSSFARLLNSCSIENKSDVVLAAIQYIRSVEKEGNTPPRDLRRLIEDTRILDKKIHQEVECFLVHWKDAGRRPGRSWFLPRVSSQKASEELLRRVD